MKNIPLSNLEQKIMEIVWEQKQCTVREIYLLMNKSKKSAYTTVSTILVRLYQKGLVKRKEQGKGYVYLPTISKEVYTKRLAKGFLSRFITSFGNVAIASFAESIEDLPSDKRKYFLKMLEEYEKTK